MDEKEKMKGFLQVLADYYRQNESPSLEGLLLSKGQWFQGRVTSDVYEGTRRWKNANLPKVQDCYFNAQQFCLDEPDGRYFEGYVLFSPESLPIEHAWIVMPDGKVVDFTLEAMEPKAKRQGLDGDARETIYLGLEVPGEFFRESQDNGEFDAVALAYSLQAGQN